MAEIFIPSAGLLFICMASSILASIYYAYLAWFEESQAFFVAFLLFEVVLVPSVACFAIYLLPKTRFGKRLLLEGPKPDEVDAFAEEEEHLESYVGQIGEALSRMSPGGMMKIDGERIHCFTEGGIVKRGDNVKVVRVSGSRLVVRKAEPGEEKPKEENSAGKLEVDTDAKDGNGLDFDMS